MINAGGIINVSGEVLRDYDRARATAAVERTALTLNTIFETAQRSDLPTSEVADRIAAPRARHAA